MRVGVVEYINAYPLLLALKKHSPLLGPPALINQLYRENKVDLFFGSSIESLETPYVPDVCVAAHGKIRSVNLYTKVPPRQIRTLRFDPASATSNALLTILLEEHWKVDAEPVEGEADAFLKIGDPALLTPTIPGYTTIDLATAWYELTALPFVFALLLHRPGLDYGAIQQRVEEVCKGDYISPAAKHFGLDADFLAEYFKLCHYHLGAEEKRGLDLFVQRIRT